MDDCFAPGTRAMIDARAASFDQHRKSPLYGSKIQRLPPALNAWPLRMELLPAWQPRAPPFPWKPDRHSNPVPMPTAAMCRFYWSTCSLLALWGRSPVPGISLFDLVWLEVRRGFRRYSIHDGAILNLHIDICRVRNAAVKDDPSLTT